MSTKLKGMPTSMPDELIKALGQVVAALQDFAGECQEAFDERSERWQEGDTGQAYQAWIEDVQNLASTVESEMIDEFDG